jgi:hypothetical protein
MRNTLAVLVVWLGWCAGAALAQNTAPLHLVQTITMDSEDGPSAQFKVVNKFPLEGASRWDYLYVDGQARRVYMARYALFRSRRRFWRRR